jgi:hypothetical protein
LVAVADSATITKTDRSDKVVIKKSYKRIEADKHYLGKRITQIKFFTKISDHQQSEAQNCSRGLSHTPISAGGR